MVFVYSIVVPLVYFTKRFIKGTPNDPKRSDEENGSIILGPAKLTHGGKYDHETEFVGCGLIPLPDSAK